MSRPKLESRYRECASLYRGDILCTDQAVPVQEKERAVLIYIGETYYARIRLCQFRKRKELYKHRNGNSVHGNKG